MNLGVYAFFAQRSRPKSYLGKLLVIAFFGVHVPLIALVAWVVIARGSFSDIIPVLLVALVATLAGTIMTTYLQWQLLAPVLATTRALSDYFTKKQRPNLPLEFGDEAGVLMRDAQRCITHLDELLAVKNELLATLAHDGRLPLAAISAAGETMHAVLERSPSDRATLKKMLSIIETSAERQAALMRDLLALARADSGKLPVELEEVSLSVMAERVRRQTEQAASTKGVTVELRELPANAVKVDAKKTEQVLANLVHNAIKFTPRGGRVTVSGRTRGAELELEVKDTGIGIAPETMEKLYDAFGEARRLGTDREPGFGLGLWIVKTFSELQGGRVSCSSKVGEGTTFVVTLPIHT